MSRKREEHIFEPELVWTDIRLFCDGAWDFMQSRNGRKRIRIVLAPFFLVGSIMLLVIGATWAKLLAPECGQDLDSAKFSVSYTDTRRIVGGNACPGYDWNSQTRPKDRETAGEYKFSYSLPLVPRMSMNPTYVGTSSSVNGPIGISLNGIPIYGPSTRDGIDTVESNGENLIVLINVISFTCLSSTSLFSSFSVSRTCDVSNTSDFHPKQHISSIITAPTYDQCGGYSSPPYRGPFSVPITGYYHYNAMPGVREPSNSAILYCPEISSWYNESDSVGGHSPLVGFMADGIPIYGPYTKRNKLPTDLDTCGGHSSDANSFYHYHFQNKYPYSVECLRGCLDGSMNSKLDNGECTVDTTRKYDYSSLLTLDTEYGGNGENHTNWTGPASLLSFGFFLFLPSALFCMCICCSSKDSRTQGPGPLSDMQEYDEHAGDNVL